MSDNSQASVERVKQEVERWIEAARSAGERTLEAMGLTPGTRSALPAFDVLETDTAVEVWADVPGLSADAVQLSTTESQLTLRLIRPEPHETLGRFHLRERYPASCERTISLPAIISPDQTTAKLKDGVLHVTLAKQHVTTAHSVPVTVVPHA